MLYLQKNAENSMITDSVVSYIPGNIQISLDNVIIGSYVNSSTDKNYFKLRIPASNLSEISNGEHKMKFIYVEEVIKEELCMIKDTSLIEPIFTETKIIKDFVYEK